MKISNSFLIYASNILAETDDGISGGRLVSYFNTKSVQYAVDIPHTKVPFEDRITKRIAFLQNIEKFSADQQFQIIDELIDHPWVKQTEKVKELKQKLYQQYGQSANKSISQTELVQVTKHWLEKYPSSYKQYISALKKYDDKVYERNILDDLRVALELLLKDVLSNSKALEKQLPDLGAYLKQKNVSPEITNMYNKLLDYYSKYQNEYVKHNNKVNSNEIELMIDLTSIFMKFLIK
jgi:hypothetical protein